MRLSIFTVFFIVIYTTWASQEPIDTLGNGTIAISKRVIEPSTQSPHNSLFPDEESPQWSFLLPKKSKFEDMEKVWKKRNTKRKFATDLFSVRLPGDVPALIRKRIRRLDNSEDGRLVDREIKFLQKSGLFKEWATKYMERSIVGRRHREVIYIAMADKEYVSGKETGLDTQDLLSLRQNAQKVYSLRGFEDVGIDKDDYVYQLEPDGKYSAVLV